MTPWSEVRHAKSTRKRMFFKEMYVTHGTLLQLDDTPPPHERGPPPPQRWFQT